MASISIKKAWVKISSADREMELVNTSNPDNGKIMLLHLAVTNNTEENANVSIYVKSGSVTEEIWLPTVTISSHNQYLSNDKWFIELPNKSVRVKSSVAGIIFECTYATNVA